MKTQVSAKKAKALAAELDVILERCHQSMAVFICRAEKLALYIVDKKSAWWFFCNVRGLESLFKKRANFTAKKRRKGLLDSMTDSWRWYAVEDYYFWAGGANLKPNGSRDAVVTTLKNDIGKLEGITRKLKACAFIGDPLELTDKEAIFIAQWVVSDIAI